MSLVGSFGLSALFAVFFYLTIANATVIVRARLEYSFKESWVPLIGGLCGLTACLLTPLSELQHFWWMPLVLDYGSLPGLVHAVVAYLANGTGSHPPKD